MGERLNNFLKVILKTQDSNWGSLALKDKIILSDILQWLGVQFWCEANRGLNLLTPVTY